MASTTAELNFKFYYVLINYSLKLRNHRWLMDIILDGTVLGLLRTLAFTWVRWETEGFWAGQWNDLTYILKYHFRVCIKSKLKGIEDINRGTWKATVTWERWRLFGQADGSGGGEEWSGSPCILKLGPMQGKYLPNAHCICDKGHGIKMLTCLQSRLSWIFIFFKHWLL